MRLKLSIDSVKEKFVETLQKKITFEEVSSWASEMIARDEQGKLEYDLRL